MAAVVVGTRPLLTEFAQVPAGTTILLDETIKVDQLEISGVAVVDPKASLELVCVAAAAVLCFLTSFACSLKS